MPELTGTAPDGKGGINSQFVDAEGRAGTRALSETDQQHAVKEGEAFSFHSFDSGATAGEETWFLQNDGNEIHLDRIVISTSASGVFSVMRQTSGTAAGTTMEGRSMIAGNAIMSDVTAFGLASVTGSVDGDDIDVQDIGTSTPYTFELDGYLIPKGQAVFVRMATNGLVYITGFVHREE